MLDKKVHIIRTHNFDNKNVSFDENAPLLQDNFASIIKHNSWYINLIFFFLMPNEFILQQTSIPEKKYNS